MREKLNVCLMNDSFPPLIDGVANAVVNYGEIIEKQLGHAIVAVPNYPDNNDSSYPFPIVRYRSLDTTKLVGYRSGYPFSASSIHALEEQNIDVIHSHCPFASTLFARTVRETVDAPIILTYHTKFDIDICRAVESEFIQQSAIKFIVNNIDACDEVWVVSNGAGENLRKLGYDGEYHVMENGVDFPRGRVPEKNVHKLREKLQIPSGVPVFMFVGRMMWYKGIRIILDSIKNLKDQNIDCRMIFIGNGSEADEIKEYCSELKLNDKCIFPGPVHDRELLRTYYCLGDMFLFPSTFDTNGIVVREAAACGLGSILIRDSCAAEGIEDGKTGILIEENAESLTCSLIKLCGNMELARSIGQNAMDNIYVSWEDSVKTAYNRYFTVLDKYKRGETKKNVSKLDGFLGVMADICDAIERVRSAKGTLDKKLDNFQDKLTNYFNK